MKFSLFNRIFDKKLIKGFPPCTDCPGSDSDCNDPCGCGDGGAGGCGSGGSGAGAGKGGPGAGGAGGGSGPSPRSGGSGGWGGPGGEIEQPSIEIFDDPNFAENVSSEVEEFLAVGQNTYYGSQLSPVDPNADAPFPFGNGPKCGSVPVSAMFGGGNCGNGCGPGCGGGDGFSADFGGGNPFINIQNGNFNFNISLFGQGNGNNMIGATLIY